MKLRFDVGNSRDTTLAAWCEKHPRLRFDVGKSRDTTEESRKLGVTELRFDVGRYRYAISNQTLK